MLLWSQLFCCFLLVACALAKSDKRSRNATNDKKFKSCVSGFCLPNNYRYKMAVNISLICKTDLLYSQFSILELPKTTGGKTHIKADLEVLDILKVGIKEILVLYLDYENLCRI